MLTALKYLKKFLIINLCIITLTGCYDYGAIKQTLQNNYDRVNPDKDSAFCLDLNVKVAFPYTTQNKEQPPSDANDAVTFAYEDNELLNKKLPMFSRLGLFEQQLITPAEQAPLGRAIYQYALTKEGEKYITQWADGTTLCFGHRVIIDILSDAKSTDNWGGEVVRINFSYSVEGMPTWIADPELNETYNFKSFGLKTDGSVSHGTLFLRDSHNGLRITSGPSGVWIFR